MSEEKDYIQINVVIPPKMKEWLDQHKEINRSELFRQAVKRKMYVVEQKVNPIFFLATVMGVMFGVVLILVGLSRVPLHIYAKMILMLMGGILSFLSALLYYKEQRNLKLGEASNV